MINKLSVVAAASGLIVFLAGLTPAHNEEKTPQPGQKIERSIVVDPQATITLCVASGALTVRGWDNHEVRVRSNDAQQLEFRRIDKAKEPNSPASRIDVMVLDKTSRANTKLDCQAIAEVEMYVPAGAIVQVQTRDGDINISGVAGAYAGSQNGDITIERVTRLIEAGSVGGSITLSDSSGRVNLSSAGGGVEVTNVRAANAEDIFEVGTVSGDIQLEHIAVPRLSAKTVSGTLMMSGALVKSGYYAFTNVTGDTVLALPPDASFRLAAKVSDKQDIVSEFDLRYLSETDPPSSPGPVVVPPAPKPVEPTQPRLPPGKDKPVAKERDKPATKTGPVVAPVPLRRSTLIVPYVRRIEAICGSGDAAISIASFGGAVRLKKL